VIEESLMVSLFGALVAASLAAPQLWYLLPLLVAVSLVYGATRHELPGQIMNHAVRTAGWMLSFIGVIFVILLLVSWSL
jgi:hypothetical protein